MKKNSFLDMKLKKIAFNKTVWIFLLFNVALKDTVINVFRQLNQSSSAQTSWSGW